MVVVSTRRLALAMVVVAAATLMHADHGVLAQCGGTFPELVAKCREFVQATGPKIPPSPECCTEVKKYDIPCVCKLVTADIEKLVNMEKAVYVARTCGIIVAPGLKCGSQKFCCNPNEF